MYEGRSATVMSSALATEHGRSALIKVVATNDSVAPKLMMMHNNRVVAATACTRPSGQPQGDKRS
jgi:hypothetical protein